jgi:hypothetical protein
MIPLEIEGTLCHGDLNSARTGPQRTVLGMPHRTVLPTHADSEMIRLYYHLHDEEARRRMNKLDFLGGAGGRSAGDNEHGLNGEDVEPQSPEKSDNG